MVEIEKKPRGLSLSAQQVARWAIARENHSQVGNAWTTKPICDQGLWIQARFKVKTDSESIDPILWRMKRDETIKIRIQQLKAEYGLVENVHDAAGGRYSYNNVSFMTGPLKLIGIPDVGCTNGGTLVRTPHMRDLAEHYDKCEVIRESDRGRVDRFEVALIEGICGLHGKTELRYAQMESGTLVFKREVVPEEWEQSSMEAANAAARLVAGLRPSACGTCYICRAVGSLSWWKKYWLGL